MQHYKKLMALTVGLLFAIFSGGLSAEFISVSDWFHALPFPSFTPPPAFFETVWLLVYIFSAYFVADAVATPKLRKTFYVWFAMTLLQPLFCFVFFRMHLLLASLTLLIIIFFAQLFILFQMLSVKKWEPLFALPIVMWYMFLISLVYAIVLAA